MVQLATNNSVRSVFCKIDFLLSVHILQFILNILLPYLIHFDRCEM